MLDSISRLGDLIKTGFTPVDPIKATNVLAIVFVSSGKDLSYQCIKLEEKKEEKTLLVL